MKNDLCLFSKEIGHESIKDYTEKCINLKRMNTATMVIVFTDTHVVVAVSGSGKGYIALRKHENFSNHKLIESQIVPNNKYIHGKIMANLNSDFEAEIQENVEKLKESSEFAPPWKHTNCAEPHGITVSGRAKKIFGDHVANDIGKIKYMAVYRIDPETMDLTEFERCAFCKITTSDKYQPGLIILTEPRK